MHDHGGKYMYVVSVPYMQIIYKITQAKIQVGSLPACQRAASPVSTAYREISTACAGRVDHVRGFHYGGTPYGYEVRDVVKGVNPMRRKRQKPPAPARHAHRQVK